MRKTIATCLLALAFMAPAYAAQSQTIGDEAVKAKREAGSEIRHAGREVKSTGRKARQAVITRCADGRHTARGKAGCKGHGGVLDPK